MKLKTVGDDLIHLMDKLADQDILQGDEIFEYIKVNKIIPHGKLWKCRPHRLYRWNKPILKWEFVNEQT